MAYDLSLLDSLDTRYRYQGTSILVEIYHKQTAVVYDSFEFTNVPVGAVPMEVHEMAARRRMDLATGWGLYSDGNLSGPGAAAVRGSFSAGLPIRSPRGGSRITGKSSSTSSGNYTMHACIPFPRRFSLVQFIFEGKTANASFKGVYSASSRRGNGYTPYDATDTAITTPQAMTFGSTDPLNPLNPGGGAPTGSCPAGTIVGDGANDNTIVSHVLSDILPCRSIDRLDGGTNWLVMARVQSANPVPACPAPTINPSASTANNGPIQSVEPDWAGGYVSGSDGIANYAAYAPTGFDWISPVGAYFWADEEIISGESYGDSTQTGWGPSATPVGGGAVQGYVRTAMRTLRSAGLPVTHVNRAVESQRAQAFLANALRTLPFSRPTFVVLRTWSVNDTGTAEAFEACWSLLVQVIALCHRYGIIPILEVPPPQGLTTSEARRVAYCQRVRATGCVLFDLDALTTDGAANANIRAPLQVGDNIHFSRAGHDYLAGELVKLLGKVLAVNI